MSKHKRIQLSKKKQNQTAVPSKLYEGIKKFCISIYSIICTYNQWLNLFLTN